MVFVLKSDEFLTEFERIKISIEKGTTPVFSELRNAKTTLKELIPYLAIQSILLVLSTVIVSRIQTDELTSMVIILVANTISQTLANVLLVLIKHFFRVRKLKRYGLEATEKNLSVLECMEYQSV